MFHLSDSSLPHAPQWPLAFNSTERARHPIICVRLDRSDNMPSAIAVIRDLLFSSRITGAGRAAGIPVAIAPTTEALNEKLAAGPVYLVMVDMSLPLDIATGAIAIASRHTSRPRVVAFFSHVDTRLRDAAIEAGATDVMPRSRFVLELPALLSGGAPSEEESARS